MTDPTRIGGAPPPPLQAFHDKAQEGETVHVSVDGEGFKVMAQGQLHAQGTGARSVAWVQGEVDTTGVFVRALSQSFGSSLSGSVARELGLDPAPGKPLESRTVMQAIDVAQTGRQALAGVDFLTRLEHSAQSQGPAFTAIAKSLGLDPGALTGEQRAAIDARMQARFESAALQGQSPVSAQDAAAWLRAELAALPGPAS